MAIKTLPSRHLVRALLDYDETTGVFTWLPRPQEMFLNTQNFRLWNTRYSGKAAGTFKPEGHLAISVGHTQYRAHRLAWLYAHGEPVPELIDHIDGNKLNNRISNIRVATKAQNGANMRVRPANTSGIKGVDLWHGYYRARVVLHGKERYTGYFKSLEEAATARREAAERLHGEFARHQ